MRRGVTVKGLTAAFSLSALVFVPGVLWMMGIPPPLAAKNAVPPPALAAIQSISELATTRVHISDVIEGENKHYKGRWMLHGEVLLGVDLAEVRYAKVDVEKRKAVLRLPPPHMVSGKVDHERSEEISLESKVWGLPLSDRQLLRAEVWKQADRKIQKLGQEQGHMERARVQAERVLEDLFKGAGWTVRFEWQDGGPAKGDVFAADAGW